MINRQDGSFKVFIYVFKTIVDPFNGGECKSILGTHYKQEERLVHYYKNIEWQFKETAVSDFIWTPKYIKVSNLLLAHLSLASALKGCQISSLSIHGHNEKHFFCLLVVIIFTLLQHRYIKGQIWLYLYRKFQLGLINRFKHFELVKIFDR